ncbi:MAG: arginine deiminase [Spiroplasma sp.]
MERPISVFSEIGKLKSVLLHRPWNEVENLTPALLKGLLFDDIMDKKLAEEEHDVFKKTLQDNDVEVFYIEELVAKTLDENPELKNNLVDQFIEEAKVEKKYISKYRNFLLKKKNLDMVKHMIAGTKKSDLKVKDKDDSPFIADPLPNILFQRDPFASIGHGITLHKMWSKTRNRETIFPEFVFKYNKMFKDKVNFYYQRTDKYHIEGGDIMVLNKDILIIGLSQRTQMKAIKTVAQRIFADINNTFSRIVVIDLPKTRAFMHLDTVFTNINYGTFIVHPLIFDYIDQFKIWEITIDKKQRIKQDLETYLSELLKIKITLIKCGGDDVIAAGREQWNDGTNVLVVEPGKVIAYARNHVTIDLLKKAGIKVLTVPSSELSRGRGGPRCMSMPLIRE